MAKQTAEHNTAMQRLEGDSDITPRTCKQNAESDITSWIQSAEAALAAPPQSIAEQQESCSEEMAQEVCARALTVSWLCISVHCLSV